MSTRVTDPTPHKKTILDLGEAKKDGFTMADCMKKLSKLTRFQVQRLVRGLVDAGELTQSGPRSATVYAKATKKKK